MSVGKSIRLYLRWHAGGLLAALLGRQETSRTRIYILLAEDPDSLGRSLAYIGEGDEVRTRLRQHARAEEQGGKDFRDRAIVLTSKDANLTKAHARYLESRLITLAQQARRSRLVTRVQSRHSARMAIRCPAEALAPRYRDSVRPEPVGEASLIYSWG